MRQVTAVSESATTAVAVADVLASLEASLTGEAPSLLMVFASPTHGLAEAALPEALRARWPAAELVGCSGQGILAGGRELEDATALAVTAFVMPGVQVGTVRLPASVVGRDEPPTADAIRAVVPLPAEAPAVVMLLPDPFSVHVEGLLEAVDEALPASTVFGALASGGRQPGTCTVYAGTDAWHDGAVAVWMVGDVAADVVVAQGCRPEGPTLRVSEAKGPVVLGLDDHPALPALRAAVDALSAPSRRLFQRAPMIGVRGEADDAAVLDDPYLVRQIMGVDPGREAFAVGHHLQAGDQLQLHVRDPVRSVGDLTEQVGRWRRAHGRAPDGVILLTCIGRGEAFYGRPDVDSRAVQEQLGDVPIAGFFANGELGPVRDRTWLHGHTAVVALLYTPEWN